MVSGSFGGSGLLSVDHAGLGSTISCKTRLNPSIARERRQTTGIFWVVLWSIGSPYLLVFLVLCGEESVQAFVCVHKCEFVLLQCRPTLLMRATACHQSHSRRSA